MCGGMRVLSLLRLLTFCFGTGASELVKSHPKNMDETSPKKWMRFFSFKLSLGYVYLHVYICTYMYTYIVIGVVGRRGEVRGYCPRLTAFQKPPRAVLFFPFIFCHVHV